VLIKKNRRNARLRRERGAGRSTRENTHKEKAGAGIVGRIGENLSVLSSASIIGKIDKGKP